MYDDDGDDDGDYGDTLRLGLMCCTSHCCNSILPSRPRSPAVNVIIVIVIMMTLMMMIMMNMVMMIMMLNNYHHSPVTDTSDPSFGD